MRESIGGGGKNFSLKFPTNYYFVQKKGVRDQPRQFQGGVAVKTNREALLYINDLPKNLKCDAFLYADDVKISNSIYSPHDSVKLQQDLNSISAWSDKWLLKFNVDKCYHLKLGKKLIAKYYLPSKEITTVSEEKDLGITFTDDLSPGTHIAQKITTANKLLGLIQRSFSHFSINSFRTLYKIYC